MIKKVLIANRGEIALRIIRACKELGLKTVSIHSEADKYSLHRKFADEDICIGPASPADTYLNIPRIISAALITGADAIHPGYGFLAENGKFAEICEKHKIVFIGPTREMIDLMGDKITAKNTMKKAGVPVIPGSDGLVNSIDEAKSICKDIGYPIMLKATAGGGGRGIRVIWNEKELIENFPIVQAEAKAAFGNPGIYIEKFIENPRHIEFQILADKHGNVVHLGERDCTIQRRHQKLVEETPSPIMTPELREKMGEAAVKGAKSINYKSVGTIEFIVDKNKNFYFMEMNTRIQVEHTITEEVTKINLIKEQIMVELGEKLHFKQNDIKFNGHSIQCRINCEDPYNNFAPYPGKITSLHFPAGFGVRVDSHIYSGYEIPTYYDSLIAKLIVWANSRNEAINRMKRCLEEIVIEGIKTTVPFHKQLFENKKFISGDYDTHFLDSFKLK